jgi:type III pantothenate kinase
MALAKPVIATNAGGPRDIVEDGTTGRLVPPRDPTALAEAIHQLIADPACMRRMGERGQQRFEQQFTAARMAKDTIAVYDAALSPVGATPTAPELNHDPAPTDPPTEPARAPG